MSIPGTGKTRAVATLGMETGRKQPQRKRKIKEEPQRVWLPDLVFSCSESRSVKTAKGFILDLGVDRKQ